MHELILYPKAVFKINSLSEGTLLDSWFSTGSGEKKYIYIDKINKNKSIALVHQEENMAKPE